MEEIINNVLKHFLVIVLVGHSYLEMEIYINWNRELSVIASLHASESPKTETCMYIVFFRVEWTEYSQ